MKPHRDHISGLRSVQVFDGSSILVLCFTPLSVKSVNSPRFFSKYGDVIGSRIKVNLNQSIQDVL